MEIVITIPGMNEETREKVVDFVLALFVLLGIEETAIVATHKLEVEDGEEAN